MKIILLGATGMIGQGALLQALEDPRVETVLALGRSASGKSHPKLKDVVVKDLFALGDVEAQLTGYDACFFCLGVSSGGMTEEAYDRVTFQLTVSVAQVLLRLNPSLAFIYISGASTDSSEKGRMMWARIKGKTENALLKMPFTSSFMFRPGFIQPMDGIQSRTPSYRLLYKVGAPLYPLLRTLFPGTVTNTRLLAKAMLNAAHAGAPRRILESNDINALAGD